MGLFGAVLFTLFVLGLLSVAAYFVVRFRQGAALGVQLKPLSLDDRLRISLAIAALGSAEKELAKVAWIDHMPGNPRVNDLHWEVHTLMQRMRTLLRES